jgi:hypothetical protein
MANRSRSPDHHHLVNRVLADRRDGGRINLARERSAATSAPQMRES